MSLRKRFLRALAVLFTLPLLVQPAQATWSIVIVHRGTGEVAIGAATCLEGPSLGYIVPILWVGAGATASQAGVNLTNHKMIRNGIRDGLTPQEILDRIFAIGNPSGQQFGIATFTGPAVTWSAGGVQQAKPSVVGEIGDVSYSIQGNILAGDAVVFEAERALLETDGDVAQRLMAGMLAAARAGGDGRCSCRPNDPTGCGAPPDAFEKSAHAARMIVARIGDTNGTCNGLQGCASGDYYLDLEFPGQSEDPDPVLQLQEQFGAWRKALEGRPDHLRSRVRVSADRIAADGESTLDVLVQLRDLNGRALDRGGALLEVSASISGSALVAVGAVRDHGNGSYSFPVRAGMDTGIERLSITVDDGKGEVRLYPNLSIHLEEPLRRPRRKAPRSPIQLPSSAETISSSPSL